MIFISHAQRKRNSKDGTAKGNKKGEGNASTADGVSGECGGNVASASDVSLR
jgi:hypothetical protein